MKMKTKATQRGFLYNEFTDSNGTECSLQESSIATEARVWFGANEIGLQRFEPRIGWSEVKLTQDPPDGIIYSANTRMHLNQAMVKKLLPALQHFAETGYLPNEE